jgi:hypothetical protein
MPTNGVIYIAYGAKYAAEAARSAASVKQWMPDLPITLFTESPPAEAPFDQIVEVTAQPYHRKLKLRCLAQTPYERTLFLDTDTYVCGDIRPLFALLDEFDFAAAHDSERIRAKDAQFMPDVIAQVPLPFAQFNSGVILYKLSSEMRRLLADWENVLERHGQVAKERGLRRAIDQTALREALYTSRVRVATLTPEYNCSAGNVGFLEGAVKIMHGREFEYERRAAELNRSLYKRVFVTFPDGARLITKRQVKRDERGFVRHLRLRLAALAFKLV